jgi:hypothetical protein
LDKVKDVKEQGLPLYYLNQSGFRASPNNLKEQRLTQLPCSIIATAKFQECQQNPIFRERSQSAKGYSRLN